MFPRRLQIFFKYYPVRPPPPPTHPSCSPFLLYFPPKHRLLASTPRTQCWLTVRPALSPRAAAAGQGGASVLFTAESPWTRALPGPLQAQGEVGRHRGRDAGLPQDRDRFRGPRSVGWDWGGSKSTLYCFIFSSTKNPEANITSASVKQV